MQAALIAVTAAVALAGIAWTALSPDAEEPPFYDFTHLDCSQPLQPLTGQAESGVVVAVENQADAASLRVCIYDEDRVKRLDQSFPLTARGNDGRLLHLPPGLYGLVLRVQDGAGSTATLHSVSDLRTCAYRLHEVETRASGSQLQIQAANARCTEVADAQTAETQQTLGWASAIQGGKAGPGLVAGAATILVVAPLVAWWRHDLSFLFYSLFSRLQRPRLLDQPTRSRIHELVQSQPGIHGSAIAKQLELGMGTTVHHMRILARERQLTCLRVFGRSHYFLHGRYSPQQMRMLATSTHPGLHRVYQGIVAHPGLSVTELAQRCGLSLGRTSKLAHRLQSEGLVHPLRQGRATRWHPASATPPA